MPSWFKKVFKGGAAEPQTIEVEASKESAQMVSEPPALEPIAPSPDGPSPYGDETPGLRKVVNAPVILPDEERSSWSEDIRIKAEVARDMTSCMFYVDRPVLEGLSAWFPQAEGSGGVSGLAEALFTVEGSGSVSLHDTTVTITAGYGNTRPWEDLAAEIGNVLRSYLKKDEPVISEAFMKELPPEEEVHRRLQACVDFEINPGIAAHSGVVTLERVVGNTVYITMGGGCQGCAASAITLRQGIHGAFRKAVPQIGAIYDETDHDAGTNPYYSEIPAGMAPN